MIRKERRLATPAGLGGTFLEKKRFPLDSHLAGCCFRNSNLVPTPVPLLIFQVFALAVWDAGLDGELEVVLLPHPDEVVPVLGAGVDGRVQPPGLHHVSQKADDVQVGALAAGVGADEGVKPIHRLPDVAEAAVIFGLNAAEHRADSFGKALSHRTLSFVRRS
jgi:hypothetical protein